MKSAYVTGADRGLGEALARALLMEGYDVFAGQYLPEWPQLTALAKAYPDQLTILPLDVTSDVSVATAAELVAAKADHLDLLINNAALFRDRSGSVMDDLYFDDMLTLYDTNCLGPLRVTHSVLPLLRAGDKKLLVNISSEAGSIGQCWRKKEYGYAMSKAALNMQSAILRNHLEEYGIRVMAIHPGYVRSYMLGHFNEEATVDADESASGILERIRTLADKNAPTYLDYQGTALPW